MIRRHSLLFALAALGVFPTAPLTLVEPMEPSPEPSTDDVNETPRPVNGATASVNNNPDGMNAR